MTLLQALILGVIQGITEFVPISSSGNLGLAPWLFGWDFLVQNPDINKTFDVALHFGTLLAACVAMRREVMALLRASWGIVRDRRIDTFDRRLVVYLLMATVPAGIAGVAFEDFIEQTLSAPWVIALALAFFGVVMWVVDRLAATTRDLESLRARDAVFIGAAQAIALVPGTSRSGITITSGVFLGLTRVSAVRFSFLLSLPVIAGASAFKLYGLLTEPMAAGIGVSHFLVGILASALTGYLAIEWLLRYLRRRTLLIFALYRFALALVVSVLIITGLRPAS